MFLSMKKGYWKSVLIGPIGTIGLSVIRYPRASVLAPHQMRDTIPLGHWGTKIVPLRVPYYEQHPFLSVSECNTCSIHPWPSDLTKSVSLCTGFRRHPGGNIWNFPCFLRSVNLCQYFWSEKHHALNPCSQAPESLLNGVCEWWKSAPCRQGGNPVCKWVYINWKFFTFFLAYVYRIFHSG